MIKAIQMITSTTFLVILLAGIFISNSSLGQQDANYEESKVPKYELPSILGEVNNVADWENIRHQELIELFKKEVYGEADLSNLKVEFQQMFLKKDALNGKATMKEIECTLSNQGKTHTFSLLIFLPNSISYSPLFLGLNFYGNHTISEEKEISLSKSWIPNKDEFSIFNNRANEESRGVRAYRWPVEQIIENGFGLATIYCGDLDPDFDDGFKNGIHSILENGDMGTIGAWALGLSKAMDYFEKDDQIDHRNIAIFGHSRLGKAVLWASAQDPRFKITISNESGCGGAAISKRAFGETVKIINNSFPHWFGQKFKNYAGKEDELPLDQHQLLALIAPRALYVASAEEDRWSDPRGEYLSLFHANSVYELYGNMAIPFEHEVAPLDWKYFLEFAERHFKNK
jgi:hypothetical protein